MTEIEKILTTEWAGIPLVLWLGLLLLAIGILRVRRFHVKFKSRDRHLEIETDNSPTHRKE